MFWKISWINVLLIISVFQYFDAFLFQDKRRMEPYKGTKPDFSNFVALTLENRMPWKTLNSLLFDLAPTLNEPREIIGILLKELEEKELTKYENSTLTANILKSNIKHQKITLETEIEENEQVSCTPTNETIEDEIEVLKVVKENINKEILLVMKHL